MFIIIGGVLLFFLVFSNMELMGFMVFYFYGFMEIYGFVLVCVWKLEWNGFFVEE